MLNLKLEQWLFNKKPHTNKARSQWNQYMVKVKDYKFHTMDKFHKETKVLEL